MFSEMDCFRMILGMVEIKLESFSHVFIEINQIHVATLECTYYEVQSKQYSPSTK